MEQRKHIQPIADTYNTKTNRSAISNNEHEFRGNFRDTEAEQSLKENAKSTIEKLTT